MRRRLEELGGTMSAAALPTGGFEVRAELPHETRAAR
jgi:signal transduction histidine kinase